VAFLKRIIPNMENSKISKNRHEKRIKEKDSNEKSHSSQDILYACAYCGGPIVPISNCVVCKKTDFRVCTVCNQFAEMHLHEKCTSLTSFVAKVSKNTLKRI